jgi:hypothetical protein
MRRYLADFDKLGNRLAAHAFVTVMNIERPQVSRTNGSMPHVASWTDLPPCQAGVAAALRRAFTMPADEAARKFEELLHRLG